MPSRIDIGPEGGPFVAINENSNDLELQDINGNVIAKWDETEGQWGLNNNSLTNINAIDANGVSAGSVNTGNQFTESRAPTVAIWDDGTVYADGPDGSIASDAMPAGSLIDSSLSALDTTGGTVYIQSTDRPYTTDSTIYVGQHARQLEGATRRWFWDSANRGVQIRDNGTLSAGDPIIKLGDDTTGKAFASKISNLSVSGSRNDRVGISVDASESEIEDVEVQGCANAHIKIQDGNGLKLINPRLQDGSGIGLEQQADANDVQVIGGTINRCGSLGISLNGSALNMMGTKVWSNGDGANQSGMRLADSDNNRFTNVEWDNPGNNTNINIVATSGATSEAVFGQNWFWANGTDPTEAHVDLIGAGTINATFVGCYFEAGADAFTDTSTGTLNVSVVGSYIGEQSTGINGVEGVGNIGPGAGTL